MTDSTSAPAAAPGPVAGLGRAPCIDPGQVGDLGALSCEGGGLGGGTGRNAILQLGELVLKPLGEVGRQALEGRLRLGDGAVG